MPAPALPAPAAAAFGVGLSVAGFWSAAPLGIPMPSLAWGAVFVSLGVIGRGVFEAQEALTKHDTLGLQFTLAWVLVGLLGSIFGAPLVLFGLKLVGVQDDAITAFALMFMGFTGPKGVTFAFSSVVSIANRQLGRSGSPQIPSPLPGAPDGK